MNVLSIVNQVLVLFLLIGIGWVLSALRFVDETGVQQMTRILCYLVSPCLIVNCFQMNFTASAAHAFLLAALSAAGIHLGSALLGAAVFRRKRLGERAAAMRFAVTYSNCGFMGLPLLQSSASLISVFSICSTGHMASASTAAESAQLICAKLYSTRTLLRLPSVSYCFSIKSLFPLRSGRESAMWRR